MPINVALIEDNRLVREGITALLNKWPDLKVVSGKGDDDFESLRRTNPHVVLLDIGLGKGDSIQVAARLRDEFPEARVVLMYLLPAHEDIVEFVNAGVAGFVLKDATLEDLVETIRAVASGTSVLPPTMINTLFAQIARDAIVAARPKVLESVRMTPRERQVIGLIAQGLSNKEIAMRLNVATHTVKSHVRNVMEKLTLHTRLQIAAYANSENQK